VIREPIQRFDGKMRFHTVAAASLIKGAQVKKSKKLAHAFRDREQAQIKLPAAAATHCCSTKATASRFPSAIYHQ
jgi:hypothetical protein